MSDADEDWSDDPIPLFFSVKEPGFATTMSHGLSLFGGEVPAGLSLAAGLPFSDECRFQEQQRRAAVIARRAGIRAKKRTGYTPRFLTRLIVDLAPLVPGLRHVLSDGSISATPLPQPSPKRKGGRKPFWTDEELLELHTAFEAKHAGMPGVSDRVILGEVERWLGRPDWPNNKGLRNRLAEARSLFNRFNFNHDTSAEALRQAGFIPDYAAGSEEAMMAVTRYFLSDWKRVMPAATFEEYLIAAR